MPTKIAFWISLASTLFFPLFLPYVHLFYFVPYLVLSFYRYTRLAVIWRALGCGLLLDLLSSGSFFGITSLNYCLVCMFLYGQKRNFFEDKLSTLPLMTFLFSLLSTLFALVLSFFCGISYSLTLNWVATDLIGMSFVDSLYACLFVLLWRAFQHVRQRAFKRSS